MKITKLSLTVVAISMLATASVEAATRVFLLGGQSNMAGIGAWAGTPPQAGYSADVPCPFPYSEPQTAVQFWNYGPAVQPNPTWNINVPDVGDGWVDLEPGYGHQPGEFGPEVSFGYHLHELFPNDDIYLVKEGLTSQDLAVRWNPNGGEIYDIFKNRVDAAMANLTAAGKSPMISGMIWMQGESDAMNHDWAVAYADNLADLITSVRSDFNVPDMPFVVGRITDYFAWGTTADNMLVRNAQMTVPGQVGHASWIDTDDLQWAYGGHYGTQGQIDLGIRFADAIATTTPEPATLALVCTGLLGLAGKRRLF
jgi:hypothetical protein